MEAFARNQRRGTPNKIPRYCRSPTLAMVKDKKEGDEPRANCARIMCCALYNLARSYGVNISNSMKAVSLHKLTTKFCRASSAFCNAVNLMAYSVSINVLGSMRVSALEENLSPGSTTWQSSQFVALHVWLDRFKRVSAHRLPTAFLEMLSITWFAWFKWIRAYFSVHSVFWYGCLYIIQDPNHVAAVCSGSLICLLT